MKKMGNGKIGYGTTLTWNSQAVAEITNITPPSMSADTIDITNMASTNGFREFTAGLRDGGDVKIDVNFYPGDTNGQAAMYTDFVAGTSRTAVITLPAAMGATWTFTGIISAYESEAPLDDKVSASITLKVSGVPVLGITASTGLTTPFFVVSDSAVLTPAASGSVYNYVATVLTGVASVTITPTAAAGVITVNGNIVATGVASSAITLGSAGSVTIATIVVTETNKVAKTYVVNIARL